MFANAVMIFGFVVLVVGTVLLSPLILIAVIVFNICEILVKPAEKDIKGQVTLVTGGANGLGKEISIKLAERGCQIAIVDIDAKEAESTASMLRAKYKIRAKAYKVNVTDYNEVVALSKQVEHDLGAVTILVNNAGIMTFSRFVNPDYTEVQNMINTNLTAHIWMIRAFIEKMKEQRKGHIVAISSLGGVFPVGRCMEYTATKFAVRGLMKTLRVDLKILDCDFIKTTIVCPTFLTTNQFIHKLNEKFGDINTLKPVSGEDAAKLIVNGIVSNKSELFIPSLAQMAYKLVDVLPNSWQDHLHIFLSGNKLKSFDY